MCRWDFGACTTVLRLACGSVDPPLNSRGVCTNLLTRQPKQSYGLRHHTCKIYSTAPELFEVRRLHLLLCLRRLSCPYRNGSAGVTWNWFVTDGRADFGCLGAVWCDVIRVRQRICYNHALMILRGSILLILAGPFVRYGTRLTDNKRESVRFPKNLRIAASRGSAESRARSTNKVGIRGGRGDPCVGGRSTTWCGTIQNELCSATEQLPLLSCEILTHSYHYC